MADDTIDRFIKLPDVIRPEEHGRYLVIFRETRRPDHLLVDSANSHALAWRTVETRLRESPAFHLTAIVDAASVEWFADE
jgi:hypothetical protein